MEKCLKQKIALIVGELFLSTSCSVTREEIPSIYPKSIEKAFKLLWPQKWGGSLNLQGVKFYLLIDYSAVK